MEREKSQFAHMARSSLFFVNFQTLWILPQISPHGENKMACDRNLLFNIYSMKTPLGDFIIIMTSFPIETPLGDFRLKTQLTLLASFPSWGRIFHNNDLSPNWDRSLWLVFVDILGL